MIEVFIYAAKRTAVGNYLGSLASLSAPQLGKAVIQNVIESTKIDKSAIDEVILGQVLMGGSGQNPARQSTVLAGLPHSVPAYTVNKVCGSGLKAVALAYDSIAAGNAKMILAGGQESMSQAMHGAILRASPKFAMGKFGDLSMKDLMVYDGLTDAFSNLHMGITAENVAKKYEITREQQDQFALASQQKAATAQEKGLFKDEIIDIGVASKKETITFNTDEFIRAGSTIEALAKLRAAFDPNGTVTAGNASGINDGAAILLIGDRGIGKTFNISPMARIVAHASVGIDPSIMGVAPAFAIPKALERAGWKQNSIDLFEVNEAFASQSVAVLKMLDLDTTKVNVNGGAIAIGHPIGASGARVLTTLLHQMARSNARRGVASLCIGGGQGIAICIER